MHLLTQQYNESFDTHLIKTRLPNEANAILFRQKSWQTHIRIINIRWQLVCISKTYSHHLEC